MKKLLCMALSLVLLAVALSACGGAAASTPAASAAGSTAAPADAAVSDLNVGLIASGFGTQSFNDDVKAGLDKAIAELGIQGTAVEVAEVADTANSIRTLIGQGCNYMVIPSSDFADAMVEVAEEYPEVKFVYLAAAKEGYDNIMSIEYKENEASFLAGALGALLTKSNKIGAVLAVNEPLQQRYGFGYRAGAQAVNPDCEVQVVFTNSYADVNIGHDMAEAMYQSGADYVGCYAGACNLGVFNAASEAGDGNYCFGAATGQFDKMPDKIVASVVKPVDVALYNLIADYQKTGEFAGGTATVWGLGQDGVALRYTTMNDELLASIPEDVKATIEDLRAKVVSGEIVVPATEEEFNSFSYSVA